MFGFIKNSLSKTVGALKTIVPKRKMSFTHAEIEDILIVSIVE